MIIDCHAHFEPRMLDTPKLIEKLDAAGVDRVVMIPTMNDPLPRTPKRVMSGMRWLMQRDWARPLAELGHRSTLRPGGRLKLGKLEFQIYDQPDNESVAKLLAQHPTRFLGWIFLNPGRSPDVLGELERWRHLPGMIGVKLHPHWHDYRTEILHPLLRRCEELHLPVLIHFGFGVRGDFHDVASCYPKLTVIAAHAGFPFYQRMWAHRKALPNLYVDLSSPYIDEPLARAAVRAMGPERSLYGTDAPYGFHEPDRSYDYGEIRRWVERLPISADEREGVLGGTFAELITARS